MRAGVAAATLLALLVAAPPAGAGSRALSADASMTVTASPSTAGAQRVRLTLTMRYQMQCGYPGEGPLVVTFPRAVKLPKRFPAGTVRLGTKAIPAKRHRRNVTVTIPPPTSTLCGVIAPGSLVLTFTRAAKLGNPARAGAYRFEATHKGHDASATLTIKPA
jgi:hypothetical protein